MIAAHRWRAPPPYAQKLQWKGPSGALSSKRGHFAQINLQKRHLHHLRVDETNQKHIEIDRVDEEL